MKKVIVYTASPCPYCSRAKELLKRKNIPFEEVLVSWDDEAKWKEMSAKSGMKTVPQIFVDDKCIGGYTELAALDQSGEFAKLIS